jgi:hypothetical protein
MFRSLAGFAFCTATGSSFRDENAALTLDTMVKQWKQHVVHRVAGPGDATDTYMLLQTKSTNPASSCRYHASYSGNASFSVFLVTPAPTVGI